MSDPATTTPAGAENGGKQDEAAATGAASTPRRVDFDDVSFLDEPKHRIHFRQARALLKESKYEEAADMFGALLQAVCEAEGELSPSTAPVYYQYGLALLSQVQNSSDAFGGAVKKSDGTPGVAPPAGANSSREESLEIAWEVLDVARVIYSRGDDELRLAYVHSALGQTCLENDNFVGAFSDFNECLQLREAVLPAGDRLIADACNLLGVAKLLASHSEADAAKKAALVREAKTQFAKAASTLRTNLKNQLGEVTAPELRAALDAPASSGAAKGKGKGKGKGKAAASSDGVVTLASQFALSCATPTTDAEKDVADLCEIIDELEDKVREISSPQPTDDKPAEQGTTTIGFGAGAGSGSGAAGTTSIGFGGFGGGDFQAAAAAALANVSVLQPRRKPADAPSSSLQVQSVPVKRKAGAAGDAGANKAQAHTEATPKASPPKKLREA